MNIEYKHAYLIMAHNNFELLRVLVKLLDDKRNDIYIHVDKKAGDFNKDSIINDIKYSNVFFVKRISVTWGGYSQIQNELNLLKEASKNSYKYYHFLSGVDLPLKNQDYIHNFFDENNGKEFIHFCSQQFNLDGKDRYSVYHFLQDIVGRKKGVLYYLQRFSVKIQKKMTFLHRDRKDIKYCGGSNWCSLTDQCVKYILSNEARIKRMFRYTTCCDEFFIQTIIRNSKFYNNIYNTEDSYIACMRYIDWKRGNPYIFNIEDWNELNNSAFLFARKFSLDSQQQRMLVDKLANSILNNADKK
ncbi:beta-1,6-N-acetylglucosaminyltransferase [Clostridium sp. K04]|uniref:beta-1,6-N-acetylglucosaminyltransferase n=1 Tax=Clostridium sp. K04 TaxID=2718929 RepID=UPI0021AB430B|nr:beta-1,6-N-acetylglucosaminyltransferase [Clostridium sp. K04]